jgi:phosphatidylglycerophosphate synthase
MPTPCSPSLAWISGRRACERTIADDWAPRRSRVRFGAMSAVEVYRRTRKRPDLVWNTYVCRPVAAVIVDGLKGTSVTPNQITIAAFVVALGSAAMIALMPGYTGFLLAVLVFEFSYVLDCADGMLARWRNVQSTQGHLFDFLMDELKAFLILGAVAVRLYQQHRDATFLLLGIGGLVALASGIALTTFQRRPEIAVTPAAVGAAGSAPPRSLVARTVGLAERLAKLLIHYPSYILFTALLGRIELYFYPYIAVNALYALRALTQVCWRFGRS